MKTFLPFLIHKSRRNVLKDLRLLEQSGWSPGEIRELLRLARKKDLKAGKVLSLERDLRKLEKDAGKLRERIRYNDEHAPDVYGHRRSVRDGASVDAEGKPVPWITYPAIEFLRQLDFSGKTVFEIGSGNSTLFWSERAGRLVSIEHDAAWHASLAPRLPATVSYRLIEDRAAYAAAILEYPERFDVIVIDGGIDASHRAECFGPALAKLSDDGFIIVDNSDWFPASAAILRSAGLLEVDMHGFTPINPYTSTTSFFFRRAVHLQKASPNQPTHGPGSIKVTYDAA